MDRFTSSQINEIFIMKNSVKSFISILSRKYTQNTVGTEFNQCMMEEQLSLKMKRPTNSVLLYLSNLNKVSFHGFFCNARDLIR